jgi:predicted anti-sigma-YlaC factor YlaD
MHEPIRENLEEFLAGSARQIPQEFQAHLEACEECASELRLFQTQSEMLRSLQCDADIEPRAGFYARVMERIEAHGPASIWTLLLEPSFGRRLALASATLVVLLGTYLVTTEPGDNGMATNPVTVAYDATTSPVDVASGADTLQQQRQRDAVLVNLASYHE